MLGLCLFSHTRAASSWVAGGLRSWFNFHDQKAQSERNGALYCAVSLALRGFFWRGANGKKFEPACLAPPKAVVGAVTLTSEFRANVHNELHRFLNS